MTKTAKWHQVKHRRFKNMKALLPGWLESNEIERSDTADLMDDYLFNNVCTREFWSGKRSTATRFMNYSDCCKQHRFPRKLAITRLLNWMTPETTFEEWEKEVIKYLIHDITTSEENTRLRPYQTAGVFTTPEKTYERAWITLVKDRFHEPLHTVN